MVKSSYEKHKRRGRSSRTIESFRVMPVLHPDKIELRVNWQSAYLLEPEGFTDIRNSWSKNLGVVWRPPTQPSKSKWTWMASNGDFRITLIGTTCHLENPQDWLKQPFPSSEQLSHDLCQWRYIGVVRLTCKTADPRVYLQYVGKFLEHCEQMGIEETPREIEIACDVPNDEEGKRFARLCRLKRDNPSDLTHFRQGFRNKAFQGPSREGLREYSMFETYQSSDFFSDGRHKERRQNGGRCQLVVYPSNEIRPRTDDIRVELRIGPRRLREFMNSPAYESLMQSSCYPIPQRDYIPRSVSPTLNLLSFIEPLFASHVQVEVIDLDRLYKDYPETKRWKLKSLSTRGQRYSLAKNDLARETGKYAFSIPLPRMKVLYPGQEVEPQNPILIKGSVDILND